MQVEGLQFDQWAALYREVRPTYPAAVYRALLAALGVERLALAVDLGAGAGQSVAGLLPIADRVIGVEPSAALRAEAAALYPGARFVAGTGEAMPIETGAASAVTVANAFYWMDMPAALREVDRVLARPGAFMTYKYDFPRVHDSKADRVLRTHLGQHWDAHRSRKLTDHDPTADLMRASGVFAEVTTPVVPYTIAYSARGFAAFMSSTSYVRGYTDGVADRAAYLERFAAELAAAAGSDQLAVTLVLFLNVGVKR
ncbi:MAG TPA: methyltransferase domain-containing protein [Kofleriaceae bacterium]|nr:methyltransferase domain-containing protein [Kofleriaceae bacterium]